MCGHPTSRRSRYGNTMDSFLAPFNTDERDKNNKLHLFKRVSSNQKLNSAIGKRPTEMVAIYGAAGVGRLYIMIVHSDKGGSFSPVGC